MIPIQNIYYMLSYAFRELKEGAYKKLGSETFDNALELLTEILIIAIKKLIKRGIIKDYKSKTSELSTVRGKIDLTQSLKEQTLLINKLVCHYDEFSSDIYFNQIIKTTLELLLKGPLSKSRKQQIKSLSIYFKNYKSLNPNKINWTLRITRNNSYYHLILFICQLIIKGLVINENPDDKLRDFIDDQQMHRLYEKFLLEYYRIEYPEFKVSSKQIKWALENTNTLFLPTMQSDVFIEHDGKSLIIDAKYYKNTMQTKFDRKTVHSNNLYQIFTYVKNEDLHTESEVSGLLLYARTDETVQPDETFEIGGNTIAVKTLDLSSDFENIKSQLDSIVNSFL